LAFTTGLPGWEVVVSEAEPPVEASLLPDSGLADAEVPAAAEPWLGVGPAVTVVPFPHWPTTAAALEAAGAMAVKPRAIAIAPEAPRTVIEARLKKVVTLNSPFRFALFTSHLLVIARDCAMTSD